MKIARAAALIAAIVVCLWLGSAVALAGGFKTGLYRGTTTQHRPFSFYVKVTECGRRHGLCLYTKTQAYIEMSCPSGMTDNSYADPGPLIVPKSGIVKETLTTFTTVVTYIKLAHNGTASGHFTATGEGCASGTVGFTAKRS